MEKRAQQRMERRPNLILGLNYLIRRMQMMKPPRVMGERQLPLVLILTLVPLPLLLEAGRFE